MILGIGIDIVSVARIEALRSRYGERFIRRIFTGNEAGYCLAKADPDTHLAARFAAKEAAAKALGTGLLKGVGFSDIEIVNVEGPPVLVLHNQARSLAERMGASRMHVSISHEQLHAVAIVIMEGP